MAARPLPAITGNQLIKLLVKDDWQISGRNVHVVKLRKRFTDRTRVTVVQPINEPLHKGTLSAILSSKQTAIGREGLRALIDTYGLP